MNRSLLAPLLLAPLLLAAAAAGQTYTVTTFGTSCGGSLQGQVVQHATAAALHLGVTAADPTAPAVLVLGQQLPGPVALPGGCNLLVDPRLLLAGRTGANGVARFAFRLPPIVPLTIDAQVLIVTRTPTGRVADTTNGVRLVIS